MEENPRLIRPAGARRHRLAQSLRDRDWTGILIEFLVVTLGVLLAFEIDQWGQDRRQAADERQFLERMWGETGRIAQESAASAELHQKEADALFAIYRARQNLTEVRRLESEPDGAGCRILVLPSKGLSDTTTQELTTSGRLNIVRDVGLREQLRQLAASQEEAAQQLAYFREFAPAISGRLDPYITDYLDADGSTSCHVQWSRVFTNPLAVQALARARRIHVLMAGERGEVRDDAMQIHRRLSCILHKTKCR